MRSIRALAFASLLTLAIPGLSEAQQRPLPDSFSGLAEKLLPAVVNISTTQALPEREGSDSEMPQFPPGSPFEEFLREFFGRRGMPGAPNAPPMPRRIQSLGSGFVIDPSGLIATNNHVVEGASEIEVTLQDDSTLKAEIVGTDGITDLAVLRVNPPNL